jgi:hypothetical protein
MGGGGDQGVVLVDARQPSVPRWGGVVVGDALVGVQEVGG